MEVRREGGAGVRIGVGGNWQVQKELIQKTHTQVQIHTTRLVVDEILVRVWFFAVLCAHGRRRRKRAAERFSGWT